MDHPTLRGTSIRLSLAAAMLASSAGPLAAQGTLREFAGAAAGDTFSGAIARAGDVDGDGVDDVVVGAKLVSVNGVPAGAATVFSGVDGSILHHLTGTSYAQWFGYAVDGAGDLDGDGFDDFLIGVPHDDQGFVDAGSVRAFSGQTGALLYSLPGDSYDAWHGFAVAGPGDVDNDGFPDIFAAGWRDKNNGHHAGRAKAYSGKDGSVLYVFDGDSAVDELGYSVAGAGDVNGDGFADLLAGVLDDDNTVVDAGAACVWSGSDGSILATVDGDTSFAWFGYSVAGLGDIDGDGFDDYAAGAPHDPTAGPVAGLIRVYRGSDHSIMHQILGAPGSLLGWAVSEAGDIDGDGTLDFAGGAPEHSDRGAVQVFSGANGSLIREHLGEPGSQFGYWIDALGDLNANGSPDLVAGAPFDDPNGLVDAGRGRIIVESCGASKVFGSGCPGSTGIPTISLSGCASAFGRVTLTLENAPPGAPMVVFLGSGMGFLPVTQSCGLATVPLIGSFSGVMPQAGAIAMTTDVPALATVPLSITVQAFFADPAAQGGIEASAGLQITFE